MCRKEAIKVLRESLSQCGGIKILIQPTWRYLINCVSNLAAIWEGIECKMEKSINNI
jgi:hypothetical protein